MRSRILAHVASLVLVAPVVPARATPVLSFRTLPSPSGVTVEMTTVIEAPAERVASVVGDPAAFVELFPAAEARVVGTQGEAQLVAVLMREPWPAGDVRWTETVTRRRVGDGNTWVIEREALQGGYFRHMRAVWELTPLPDDQGRCRAVYRVSMTLNRWAPSWALRRGQESGIRRSVGRLRAMVLR